MSQLGSSLLVKVAVLMHYPEIIRLSVQKMYVSYNAGTLLKALHILECRKVERNLSFAQPIVSIRK